MSFNGQCLSWSKSMKYLGINFLSGPHMVCDGDYITQKIYIASNCLFTLTTLTGVKFIKSVTYVSKCVVEQYSACSR